MSGLDARRLRGALSDCVIGRKIVVLEQTTSTNDAILQMTNADTPEGFVVFAEHQSAGRGRHGARWESAAGKGLWFSILLRPKIDIEQSARLTDWAARAIANTIKNEFALAAAIKPPNDVCIDGRKAAGVLVEMRAQKNAPHIAIVGIGLNVNHTAKEFPEAVRNRATSLAMILDRTQDRHLLAAALLRNLDRTYAQIFG
jgi:BirA family biotin operon repressor/biotin-[acetyl-CoA-carboxylase] ligase